MVDLPRLSKPAKWLNDRFVLIRSTCPSFMRPKYFSLVIYTAYKAARKAVVEQSSDFVASGHSLTHNLALCSVQMYGLVKSASISPSKPVASLAAGLPHFAAGWARCWGRDVVSRMNSKSEGIRQAYPASVHLPSWSVLDHRQLRRGQRTYPRVWDDPEARFDPQPARLDPEPEVQLP